MHACQGPGGGAPHPLFSLSAPRRPIVDPTLAIATAHHDVEAHAQSPQPRGVLLLGALPRGDLHLDAAGGCAIGARPHLRACRPVPALLGKRHPCAMAGREPAAWMVFEPGIGF